MVGSHGGHFRYRSACCKGANPGKNIAVDQGWASTIDEAVEEESSRSISKEERVIARLRSRKDRLPRTQHNGREPKQWDQSKISLPEC
jgi:hypothetical protein